MKNWQPAAQVARELGINEGTLGNWTKLHRDKRPETGDATERFRASLEHLRRPSQITRPHHMINMRARCELQLSCYTIKKRMISWIFPVAI